MTAIDVRFLVFPNIAACRALAGLADSADVDEVIGDEQGARRHRVRAWRD